MKIFPPRPPRQSFEEICAQTQQQLKMITDQKPRALVAIPEGGGYAMTVQELPDPEVTKFKLVK